MLHLRPGRPVLRRDDRTLQVGLTHPVLLPDRPEIQSLLARLAPTGSPGEPLDADDLPDSAARAALQRLEAAGHLAPADAEPRRATIGVRTFGPGLRERVGPALALAGIEADRTGEVVLVVSAGPVGRGVSDDLVHAGLPHLLVSSMDGGWRIGPFVVPGLTACLRCLDAHESAADPRRALLLTQAARAAREDPPASDPLTEQWALTWAARDLRTYLDGGEPGTWSATYDLPAPEEATSAPTVTRWLRHPDCGCSWDVLLDLP